MPVATDNTGSGEQTVVWDKYPIQIYHRIENISESNLSALGSGDEDNLIEVITNMVCIVSNDRLQTKTKPEDLAIAIMAGLNIVLTDSQINTTGVDYVGIEVTGSNLNKKSVADGEYVELRDLKTSYDLFSINYNIVQQIDTRCYTLI